MCFGPDFYGVVEILGFSFSTKLFQIRISGPRADSMVDIERLSLGIYIWHTYGD